MSDKSQYTGGHVAVTAGQLTDRELDAEIARALGWEDVDNRRAGRCRDLALRGIPPTQPTSIYGGKYRNIPHYSTDLNAIHEAEESLTLEEWLDYVRDLALDVGESEDPLIKSMQSLLHSARGPHQGKMTILSKFLVMRATARQKAEALYLTLREAR